MGRFKNHKKKNRRTAAKNIKFNILAGVDEVGRGSLVGPVYAAAVILNKSINLKILKDSKTLTKEKREYLFNPSPSSPLSMERHIGSSLRRPEAGATGRRERSPGSLPDGHGGDGFSGMGYELYKSEKKKRKKTPPNANRRVRQP